MSMSSIILIITLCAMVLLAAVTVTAFVVVILYRDGEEEDSDGFMYHGATNTLYLKTQQMPQYRRSLIVFLENPENGIRYSLNLQRPVIVGRNANGINGLNDVGIGDSIALSRQQCCFMESEGRAYLENLSRVNATFLNNQRIEQAVPIFRGDLIQAADVALIVTGIEGAVYNSTYD